jgi:PAS domain S-box-containing protein
MDDLKGAYTRADEALYAVKLAGKSGFRGWTEDVQDNKHRSILGFTTRELAEGMPLAMIAHRASGEILFANNGLARLLGFERLSGLYAEAHNDLLAIVHPDDRRRFQRLVERATADGAAEEEFELSLHVVTSDGTALPAVYRGRHVASHEKGEVLYAYIVSEHRT